MDAVNRRLVTGDRAVAVGHHVDPVIGAVQRVTKRMPASVGPAGNVVATAGALIGFVDRLFGEGDDILAQPLVAEMVTQRLPRAR